MPTRSPGQCFDEDTLVRAVTYTTPVIDSVHHGGLSTHTNFRTNRHNITLWHSAHQRPLFVTVVKYEGRGECTVKGSGSEGFASRRLVSGEFLVPQS